jgi:3-deoxy-D-manno-octulosonic-acid transferase
VRYIYSFLFYLILPFLFLRLLWRSLSSPSYRKGFFERLGFCPFKMGQCIWVHAVSVGESIAAIPLINSFKKRFPDYPIVVTNMTPTGADRIRQALGEKVYQCFIPYDLPGAAARFFSNINPSIAIIMETEIWPNLFNECQRRKIPLMIANARLSEKSLKGYQRILPFIKKTLLTIDYVAAQSKVDAARFIALGIPDERIVMTGNLKFDLQIPVDLKEKSEKLKEQLGKDRLIWIAASTHPGEEEIILGAHRLICEKYKNALLILVPRHQERFDSMTQFAKDQGFQVVRRSKNEVCTLETNVYMGDTMGELLLLYSVSEVAFVGGSFVPIGGHNMIEPAAVAKPILTGPYIFNFEEISEKLFAAHAMIKVENVNQLAKAVNDLLGSPKTRNKMGDNAYAVVEENRGALDRQVQLAVKLF